MADFKKLDALMESLPHGGIPAADLIVTHQGETVYRKQVGYSDLEGTRPVSNSDLYWLFSATKVVTCLAAMRLVEEGRLSLSDPVSKYLPAYGKIMVKRADGSVTPAENVMTVEHLFTMSGGMTYDVDWKRIAAVRELNLGTVSIVEDMAGAPLAFEPGTHFRYSLCHDVLAAVVEVVSGMPFSQYLDKIMFTPLGIREMGFFPTPEQETRFSAMYTAESGTCRAIPRATKNEYIITDRYESGGAGLFARAEEYIKILTPLSLGGTAKNGYRLLKPETVAMLGEGRLSPEVQRDFMPDRLFGYSWGLCGRAHVDPLISHARSAKGEFGWDGAAGAFALADPTNGVALFLAMHVRGCNYAYHHVHPTVRDLAFEGLGI